MSERTEGHDILLMTDSTSDIPPELMERYDIKHVPLYVLWGDEQLRDGVDIDNATFYSSITNDPIHPKTSQPTPADFVAAIKATGAREVVIITISSALSGTYTSAVAAQELLDIPVHVFDSLSTSMGLGWQVLAAARAREEGADAAGMLAAASAVQGTVSVHFTVDSLEYLYRGGRIGGAAKLLGTALQLKPLLCIDPADGRIDAVERTRTRRKAMRRVVEVTMEKVDCSKPVRVGLMHASAPEDAKKLYDVIQRIYSPVEMTISEIGPVLGTHGGPGLVGVCACNA